jgi:hypothetical protein
MEEKGFIYADVQRGRRHGVRKRKLVSASAALVAVFALPGCFPLLQEQKNGYPVNWPPIRETASAEACPHLEGLYIDAGKLGPTTTSRPCDFVDHGYGEECKSLTFNLLYTMHDSHVKGGEVRIEQPSDAAIRITAAGQQRTLTQTAGNFTCDKYGLRLKEKSQFFLFFLVNVVSFESRIFNAAQDGSLVMKAEWHNVGNRGIAPFSITDEGWVRWKQVDTKTPGESSGTPNTLYIRKSAGIYCPNADLGHADAQLYIARVYDYSAYGGQVNLVRAWVWYSLAAQNGDEVAADRVKRITEELDPQKLAEAKRQLAAWTPGQCAEELEKLIRDEGEQEVK